MPADAHLLICTVSNFIRAQRLSKCLLQRGGRTRCSFNATYYRDEYVSASSRCLGLFETASNRQKVVIMARDNVDSSLSFPPFFFQTRGAYVWFFARQKSQKWISFCLSLSLCASFHSFISSVQQIEVETKLALELMALFDQIFRRLFFRWITLA